MRFGIYLLFGFLYFFILFLGWLYGGETIFLFKSLFLTLYIVVEILAMRIKDRKNWIINPVVLASLFTFLIGYGITNLIYFIPDSEPRDKVLIRLGDSSFNFLNVAMDSVILGAVFMWLGYRSNLGSSLFKFMTAGIVNLKRYFKNTFEFNIRLIYTLVAISIIVRFYAILIGAYGYSSDPESLSKADDISQYIYYFGLLAQFSLLVVSLAYFSSSNGKSHRNILITLIIIEVIFGFMSGTKTLVVTPFVIPLTASLIIKRKIKKSLLVFSIAAILIAYIVIEPFRILNTMYPNLKNDPLYIIQTLYDSYFSSKQFGIVKETEADFFVFAFLSRANSIVEAAKAIEYKDRVGLDESDPDFTNRLFLAPIYAVTPRFIWKDKPLENIGMWFTKKVWGYDYYSATTVTPFGFLYFAGGNFLIIVFFFIFGIMQNALFRFVNLGPGGIIVFIGLLSSVVIIDHSVNSIFINWIRVYPMLVFLQYFVFKNKRTHSNNFFNKVR